MARDIIFKVISNRMLAPITYEMVLSGDVSDITAPGQFMNIKLEGKYLRRPISVCDWDGEANTLKLIYKTVGAGTEQMSKMGEGDELLILSGLGNGYDLTVSGDRPLVIGGGAGVPPMYGLAKRLVAEGKHPVALLGFNTASEAFYIEELKALGVEVLVSTVDGSLGTKGFVTTLMEEAGEYSFYYTCGPEPMLKAVHAAAKTEGLLSFEERMGCGFGACMGCSCRTLTGNKRICKEGPVMKSTEIIFKQREKKEPSELVKEKRITAVETKELADKAAGITEAPATDLSVELSGIRLDNPVIPASGTFGFGQEFAQLYDINILGSISFKGTTGEARFGNETPRIAECPNGMINAVGLQNPGVEQVIAHELPELRKIFKKPLVANISGFSIDEYVRCAELLTKEEQVGILEINVSCPNVHGGGMAFGTDPKNIEAVTKAVKAVADKPVYIKLSPNVTDIVTMAKAAEAGGADGVSLINTMLGMRINLKTGRPIIANTMGGYSGPGIFPVALRMVYQVYENVKIPIIGMGGVSSAEDVIEMMYAGASAVQIGAANLANPYACRDIIEQLPAVMKKYNINKLSDITGGAH